MGVFSTAAQARENGARLVFVDPRMPEGALGESEWIPIKPGTDAAFLHGLIFVGLRENLCNLEWMRKWTNSPCLVTDDYTPITEDMVKQGGRKRYFAVIDEHTGNIVFQGPNSMKRGSRSALTNRPTYCPPWIGTAK